MCRVNSCCFFFTLKVGTLLTSGYTILLSTVVLIMSSWFMASGLNHVLAAAKTELEMEGKYTETEIDEAISFAKGMYQVIFTVAIVMYALWLMSGLSLVAAVNQKKRGFLMPWIVWTCILTGLSCLGVINELRKIGSMNSVNIATLVIQVVVITVNFFALAGVNSYYKLKMEEPDETAMHDVAGGSISYNRMKV